jgi:hypothetical protein
MTRKTDLHAFRIPDPLWDQARTTAAEHGDNLSDIIRQALVTYIEQRGSTRVIFVTVEQIQTRGYATEVARIALEAAESFIASQALREAADILEARMTEPANYAEEQYVAGYADAVARLTLMTNAARP